MFNEKTIHNGFELTRLFSIETSVATPDEIKQLIRWRATRVGREIMARRRYGILRGKRYFKEEAPIYNENILSLPSNCYLTGYWQSEKYFYMHEEAIRNIYSFKTQMGEKNKSIAEEINKCNSIAVHIRRGDTATTEGITKDMMARIPMEYYNNALEYMKKRVDNPVIFVFSDDIEWARSNLDFPLKSYFIDHNKKMENYNDMRLMSLCKHNIIANSSFSWWGAWLNKNKDKQVVAPRRWFKCETFNSSTVVPRGWKLL
jgi:hypothetical protein